MSKIQREQVIEAAPIGTSYHNDALMSLIDQREAELQGQYQELVDAVGLWEDWYSSRSCMYASSGLEQGDNLRRVYKKLASPPPDPHKQLADRLRAVDTKNVGWFSSELREIAAEIEKLGGG